ncbi:MAG TPA: OprD family outer membrane porin [Sulfurimonas sp.]
MKRNIKLNSVLPLLFLISSIAGADEGDYKHILKKNYQLVYDSPNYVQTISDMFTDGMFYGRLRSNTFLYNWEEETASQNSHFITGIGGSLVYKTATFLDTDLTAGLYYSKAFFDEDSDSVSSLKSGKDLLSRYDYSKGDGRAMAVLGQAYLSYKGLPETEIRVGRQLVETFYTKSNDTKMIPNTFDGVVVKNRTIPNTALKIAYLTKQKLRDHTTSHSVLMYDDSDTANKSTWNGNDDSAMHKGLSYTNLTAAGKETDAPLITGDFSNRYIENLKLDASFYVVPDLLSQAMAEANYRAKVGKIVITPGIRYIKQFDNGAGEIGGASYNGNLAGVSGASGGYKDASSLDSQMIAARLVGIYKNYNINLGYSNILDEADLVTPWRGFPTAGYTRSMARYNWMANTKSYRAQLTINSNQSGAYEDLVTQLSFLHTDADESKGYFDENYYYIGFIQNIPSMSDLQWRLRLGYTDTKELYADSLDSRLEINYLF